MSASSHNSVNITLTIRMKGQEIRLIALSPVFVGIKDLGAGDVLVVDQGTPGLLALLIRATHD